MERWKKITTDLLLAFVLISIGYALGRNTAMRSVGRPDASPGNAKSVRHLIVYYTHATVRCETCNSIEKKTHELLESKFSKELADGRIEWQVVNFQENDSFAEKFDVTTSGVIAALMDGEKVVEYERLDDVWTLLEDPKSFDSYLERNFRGMLGKL